MATGSNRFLQYIKQSTPRELPSTPAFTRLRNTGGGGIANNRTNITSNEIRSDRQIIESRLGQNQPDLTIPYELSFDSYDDFIKAALGGSWVGGHTVSVTAAVDDEGAITLSGGWADENIAEGDYVLLNGEEAANTNIIGQVDSISGNVLTVVDTSGSTITTAVESSAAISLITGHYADEGIASVNAVATTQKVVRGSGSWKDLGVENGDYVFFDGFSTGGNNGWKKVKSVDSDTDLTMDDEYSAMVDDTGDTIDIFTSTGFITVGTDLDYFAVEEGFTDVDSGTDSNGDAVTAGVFHNILGCYVSNWNVSIQPDSVITGEFSLQGLIYSGFLNATVANSVIESNVKNVFDSFTGSLTIPDASDLEGVITGFDFTLDNGLTRRYALMDKNAISIGDGRSNVSGTLNAYFENADLSNLFEAETELEASVRTEDLTGNSYTFGIPKLKLTGDSRDISESDVTESLNFQGLGGLSTDKKKTLYVLRQPVVA